MDLMDFDAMAVAKPKEKKVEEKKQEIIVSKPVLNQDEKSAEQQFLEIYMLLLENILKVQDNLGDKDLIDFILVFKQIYNKDFSQDEMASNLMR